MEPVDLIDTYPISCKPLLIADILRSIVGVLSDDEEVALRFVCKQTQIILQDRPSSATTIKSCASTYKFEEVDIAMDRVRPYVGSVAMLTWAVETLGMPLNVHVCYAAVEVGALDVVQWLRENSNVKFPWRPNVCANAALHGHLHLLQWLRAQNPPCPWDAKVCKFAAWKGRFGILKWARSQSPPCPWDLQQCVDAAWGGSDEISEWLNRCVLLYSIRQDKEACVDEGASVEQNFVSAVR